MNWSIIIGIVVVIMVIVVGISIKRSSKVPKGPIVPPVIGGIGTTVNGKTTIQYGDETPESVNLTEHFEPYMSVLANDIFRSDASFDIGKLDKPPMGNYE